MKRYSTKELPPYKFVPGLNAHPYRDKRGHSFGQQEPSYTGSLENFFDDEFYKYSLDLFNFGYYWMAHVYFEALWNSFERNGGQANYFKGLIQLSAAAISLKQSKNKTFKKHLDRARELFKDLPEQYNLKNWPNLSDPHQNGVIYPFLSIYLP